MSSTSTSPTYNSLSYTTATYMLERMELMEALSSWNSGASLPSGTNSWLSHLHVRHSNLHEGNIVDVACAELIELVKRV